MMTSMEARVSKRPHEDGYNSNNNYNYSSSSSCHQHLGAAAAAFVHDDKKRCCRRSSQDSVPCTIIERPFQQLRQQESSLSFQSTTTEQSDTIRQDDDSSDNDDADDEMECTSSEGGDNDERLSMELSQQTTSQATREESIDTIMMVDDLSNQMDQTWSLTNLKAWRRRWSSLSDSNGAAVPSSHDQNSQATSRTSNKNMNDASSTCSFVANSSHTSCPAALGNGALRNIIRLQQKQAKRHVMKILRGRSSNESMSMHEHEENRTFKIANH